MAAAKSGSGGSGDSGALLCPQQAVRGGAGGYETRVSPSHGREGGVAGGIRARGGSAPRRRAGKGRRERRPSPLDLTH